MKKFLVVIFLMAGIGAAGYYLYNSDPEFKEKVDSYFSNYFGSDRFEVVEDENVEDKKTKKKPISTKPKQIKPGRFDKIDKYAMSTPNSNTTDLNTLANYLILPATNEVEKVRAIFTWIVHNIRYNDKSYNIGVYGDNSADGVLKSRTGVCAGYSNIFKGLCDEAGIESVKIVGYSKGYGYNVGDKFTKTDHAWNAVKLLGNWYLIDATWAQGYGEKINGKLVSKYKFNDYWFCTNPNAFIFSHLPKNSKWQLTSKNISLEQYENLPKIDRSLFKLGFHENYIFNNVISGIIKETPNAYSLDYPIKVISSPYKKTLVKGKNYKFEIESDYAEKIAIINNGKWTYFNKEDNSFKLNFKPEQGHLKVSFKFNAYESSYSTGLIYDVVITNDDSA